MYDKIGLISCHRGIQYDCSIGKYRQFLRSSPPAACLYQLPSPILPPGNERLATMEDAEILDIHQRLKEAAQDAGIR